MTALLAKKLTNDETHIQIFYAFLTHNYPKFMESYRIWEHHTRMNETTLSLDKFNQYFNALFGNPKFGTTFYVADTETDFNYIVDYIF